MFSLHRCLPVLLGLCLAACATARPMPHVAHAYVTGSRIPLPVDDSAGVPAPISVQQVATQRDIELTGQTNLADALRQLVPALH
jgi:hypothetical protein